MDFAAQVKIRFNNFLKSYSVLKTVKTAAYVKNKLKFKTKIEY